MFTLGYFPTVRTFDMMDLLTRYSIMYVNLGMNRRASSEPVLMIRFLPFLRIMSRIAEWMADRFNWPCGIQLDKRTTSDYDHWPIQELM